MPRFSKIWIIGILVIVFAGGFFAWQYFGVPENGGEDETANWKTYRNEKYGIELQYPYSWILNDGETSPDPTKGFIQINISNGIGGREDESVSPCQLGVASMSYQVGKLRNAQQTFEDFVNFQIENPERGLPPTVKPTLISTIVGGRNALKIEEVIDNCTTELYYVDQGLDRYTTISFIIDKNDDKQIINQILSTFRFKDNISIIYTSENYAWGERIKRIEISKNGKISYSSKIGDKKEESSKLLTEIELKELSDFIISQKFFDLAGDLTNLQCADAPTEYLEITIGGKIHRAGGGCVENETFRAIVEKLEGIVSWQTYRNEKYGFEIRYPSNWFRVAPILDPGDRSCKRDSQDEPVTILAKEFLNDCGFGLEMLPSGSADITIWVLEKPWNDPAAMLGPPKENISIGGESAVMYRFSFQQARPNVNAARIYLNHAGRGYLIFLKNTDAQGASYDPFYNQILSTFKFLE